MELLFSGVLSLISLGWASRWVRPREKTNSAIFVDSYKLGDLVFVIVLVAWFTVNILGTRGQKMEVTANLLVLNALLSFLLIACVICFLVLRGQNPLTLFGLSVGGWNRSISAALVALTVALPPIFFIHALSFRTLGSSAEIQPLLQFLIENHSLSDRLLLAFTAIVVAPVSEEIIFRGYIYGVLRRFAGRWWALAISAIIFAGIHAHLPSTAGLLALAVALTLLYEFTASLWAPILMHAIFNSITVGIALLWPQLLK